MVMSVAVPKKVSPEERRKLLKALIYERTKSGKVIYYRDYDKVLSGEKTLEEVIGSSKLQWWINRYYTPTPLQNFGCKKVCNSYQRGRFPVGAENVEEP